MLVNFALGVPFGRGNGRPAATRWRHREHEDTFAIRHVRERLAVLDGDTERIVAPLGGDLTRPHQFMQVAEAIVELGREDEVLAWAEPGIVETRVGRPLGLYDPARETHAHRGEPLEVLRPCRSHHERTPSLSTYSGRRRAGEPVDAWAVERHAATCGRGWPKVTRPPSRRRGRRL